MSNLRSNNFCSSLLMQKNVLRRSIKIDDRNATATYQVLKAIFIGFGKRRVRIMCLVIRNMLGNTINGKIKLGKLGVYIKI